ncbi:MAG: phosphoglycerate kinase [Alphaproteobacteria bacterium]|jgi:phosphoglycerate kinase|nr:phosphoglycerate kinase [Alphaproteobacteria bacterium]
MFNTIDDFDFNGKTVVLRADLNVPMEEGKVSDTTRIDRVVPTIKELQEKGAKVVVISHFGRPGGEVKSEFSLGQIVSAIETSLGSSVAFADECVGPIAKEAIAKAEAGDVILLENLRFHKDETENDEIFAKELAELGDVYINDAFSVSHRAHASTQGVTKFLPSAAGRLMQTELEALNSALEAPEKPVVAVVGGAKISTKLDLLYNIVSKVDVLILGGGMANTFDYAIGNEVGMSLCEKDMKDEALKIIAEAKKQGCEIVLPADRIAIKEFKAHAPNRVVDADNVVQEDEEFVDMGPKGIERACEIISKAKTVLWNGPFGVFEMEPFDNGTNKVAQFVGKMTAEGNLTSVAGGGDTVSALAKSGAKEQFTYVSAAGGAFLETLEGKELPGVVALEK